MLVLGIETSCDETAAALVADGRTILSNTIATQFDLLKKYGGVVPEIAARRHTELIGYVIKEALDTGGRTLDDVEAVAVTSKQGLIGCLMVGVAAETSSAAVNVIDGLVIWGQILIGIALILGVVTRFSLFWAAAMMFMFYIAQFPPAHNPFLDEHIVYIGVFLLLGALAAGRIFGLDALVERLPLVRRIPGAEYLLG